MGPTRGGSAEAFADFLGVARSLSGRRWRERPAASDLTRDHQARLGLSEPLARALASRGVAIEDGEDFLRPTLKALFPDPSTFADMDTAAAVLVDALEARSRVVVFADYDVDGAASAAQIVRWFRAMGLEIQVYVPDRMTEGYGPSGVAFRRLRSEGADLIVTVDCGAAAQDALAQAAEIGLPVVVIDHHLMRGTPPAVRALVNPNRPDCPSGQGMLAAAGVSFVLLAALNREARRRGHFERRAEPDLRQWLDLAAIGAICDVTELTGFNRALASQGLKVMSAWKNPGLAALMAVAGAHGRPAGVFEAGFILGPRINAGGRIGRSDLGARLLATDDPEEAADLARQLDSLNAERKEVERRIVLAAVEEIERASNFTPEEPAIVIAKEGWHPGVIGIVASRLRERYRRPVVVIGLDPAADVGRGSGRSQTGVNLGRAIQAAFEEGLLLAGGGHAMAAGLTVRPAAIPELRAFLCERLAVEMGLAAAHDAVDIDALIAPTAAAALKDDFRQLAPHGPGNPEPVVCLADVRVDRPRTMTGGHLRCALHSVDGGALEAVAWRSSDTEIGRHLLAAGGVLHVAGRLRVNDWNGKSVVQLEIEDAADPRRL
ncbi:MAG: single-stranded-DNA-specific exonuclease RecJ [Caulobacteraceae bacterium]